MPVFAVFESRVRRRCFANQMVKKDIATLLDLAACEDCPVAKIGFFEKEEDVLVEHPDFIQPIELS